MNYLARRALGAIRSGDNAASSQIGAWAVIQGSGTSTLHSSYNIASLTDNGAGDFSLTFAREFASASEYVILGAPIHAAGGFVNMLYTDDATASTAASCRVLSLLASALTDADPTTVLMIGRF